MEKIVVNWENMEQYSDIPIGFRFVDQAEIVPGKEGWSKKTVSSLDWYFKVHFPGDPVMPGVFLMEVMQQTGMLIVTTMPESKTKLLLLHSCESMRIYRSARPGDVLSAHVILESYRYGVAKCSGSVTVYDNLEKDEKVVCEMKFILVAPGSIVKVRPQK